MPTFGRGAKPSSRHTLLGAVPHLVLTAPPPQFAVVPKRLSFWDNEKDGVCVSSEEAFAKVWWSTYCGLPDTFASEQEVHDFAARHGWLNGATLTEVMDEMSKGAGMSISGKAYRDGGYAGVNYADRMTLQSALTVGPVKIAIDANALPQEAGNRQGWFAVPGGRFPNTDHCVGLAGYGPAGWLYQQLGVPLPPALNGATPGYLLFTWGTLGFVTHDWLMGTCAEAWVRTPTTVGQAPAPPLPPPPPPTPANKMHLALSLDLTPPHALNGTYTLSAPASAALSAHPNIKAVIADVMALFVAYSTGNVVALIAAAERLLADLGGRAAGSEGP
jgi:hypothetical protein